MGGLGAVFGIGGCLFAGWFATQHDFGVAGVFLLISVVLFAAERYVK